MSCEYLNLKEFWHLPLTESYLWYLYNDQIHTFCFDTFLIIVIQNQFD